MSLTGVEGASEFAARPMVTRVGAGQMAQVDVTVSGADLKGVAFVDECSTTEIGANGAVVTLARALGSDQELFLKYGSRERLVRVVGHSGNSYELCFHVAEPQFWGAALKYDDFSEGPLDDFYNDPPTGTDPLLVPNYAEFVNSMPPKAVARTKERRRSPRISMRQAKACIEVPGANPDIVELVDISRGGVCFRSQHLYPVGGLILIAAPYTHGSTNLFVTGRIVRINRDAWGGHYGVEFVR